MKSLVWGQHKENGESSSLSRLINCVVLGHWETPGEQVAQSGSVAPPGSFLPSQAPSAVGYGHPW